MRMEATPILAKTAGGGVIPCLTWTPVEIGDFVVYETEKGKLIILKVSKIDDLPSKLEKKATRFIVQKIDLETYRKIMEEYA